MVLACALLSAVLLAAGSAQVRALEANAASREADHRAQVAELAAEVLGYHLGLAGHRGLADLVELGGPGLTLARSGAGPHALAVRYLEERWSGEPVLRALRLEVGKDGRGEWNLYLREEGAVRQPAVQGVSGLRVTGLVLPDGRLLAGDAPLPATVAALELLVEFAWGGRRALTVTFSRPLAVAEE